MDISQNCRIDYQQRGRHQGSQSSTKNVDNRSLNVLYPLECGHQRRQMPRVIPKIEQTDPNIKTKVYFS